MLTTKHWPLTNTHWLLSTNRYDWQTLTAKRWLPTTKCWALNTDCWQPKTNQKTLIADYPTLAAEFWPPNAYLQTLTADCRMLTAKHWPSLATNGQIKNTRWCNFQQDWSHWALMWHWSHFDILLPLKLSKRQQGNWNWKILKSNAWHTKIYIYILYI